MAIKSRSASAKSVFEVSWVSTARVLLHSPCLRKPLWSSWQYLQASPNLQPLAVLCQLQGMHAPKSCAEGMLSHLGALFSCDGSGGQPGAIPGTAETCSSAGLSGRQACQEDNSAESELECLRRGVVGSKLSTSRKVFRVAI